VTVRVEAVVVARVEVPVTPRVPATPRVNPGVEDPIPTFPLARIEKKEDPEDEATLNGLRLEVDVACTLKTYEEEVALIPVKTPLSRRVDVPRVVAESQRVANPSWPPATPLAVTPSDEVATHLVDVPVDWSTIPRVPVALAAS
jgi:hypothetical protein